MCSLSLFLSCCVANADLNTSFEVCYVGLFSYPKRRTLPSTSDCFTLFIIGKSFYLRLVVYYERIRLKCDTLLLGSRVSVEHEFECLTLLAFSLLALTHFLYCKPQCHHVLLRTLANLALIMKGALRL